MNDNELVSCIIPTYKRSDMLLRAINSVLNQTYKNIEILVVDDNEPNDEYSVIVKDLINYKITDKRVRYISQEKHINGAAARNAGIRAARGTLIAFLDDDDEWLPSKIEKQVRVLQQNNNADGVSCLIEEYAKGVLIKRREPYSGDNLQFKILKGEVSVGTVSILLRKKSLDKTGYFNEKLKRNQEIQLLTSFLSENTIVVLNDYLVRVYRDDMKNRPSANQIEGIKLAFLEAVDQYIRQYSKEEQKRIVNSHYMEIVYVAIRDINFGLALKYISKIGFDMHSYIDALKRWKKRKSY